jgi:hypothetical protein
MMTGALRGIALAALGMLVVACGSNVEGPAAPTAPATPNAGNTIPFRPSEVIAVRSPAQCGTAYMAADEYALDAIGDMTRAPFNALDVTFLGAPPVDQPQTLIVRPVASQGSFASQSADNARNVTFKYAQGVDPAEIDTEAFDSVDVTLLALPAKDGDPLTVRIQAHFADGRALDETFSAPVMTTTAGCGSG